MGSHRCSLLAPALVVLAGCAGRAAPGTREVIAITASSGPRPTVAVTVLDRAGDPGTARLLLYETGPRGFALAGSVRPLELVGIADGASVAAFQAYDASRPGQLARGLVGSDGDPSGGAGTHLASILGGLVAADPERLRGVAGDGAVRWTEPLDPVPPGCDADPEPSEARMRRARLDLAVAPAGAWVGLCRVVPPSATSPCRSAAVELTRLRIGADGAPSAARTQQTLRFTGPPDAAVTCAIRDDGAALLLLPQATTSGLPLGHTAVRVDPDGTVGAPRYEGRVVLDAAPAPYGWAWLSVAGDGAAHLAMLDGDLEPLGRRPLGPGPHALVGLASALLLLSPAASGAELDVTSVRP